MASCFTSARARRTVWVPKLPDATDILAILKEKYSTHTHAYFLNSA
jgi:hypothetical protein